MGVISFEYQPLEIHSDFHRSTAYERCLFGAFGSGKTYAVCAEAIAWALEQPGSRILITRKTIPELRDTTETVFFEILPHELYKAGTVTRMGGHHDRFIFPNGSTVLFRSIDDWRKHKSLNVCAIAWDELDEFDEETYLGMTARIRQRDPTPEAKRLGVPNIRRRGMWAATNPQGKNWVYDRFVRDGGKDNTGAFYSTSFDNPFLSPDYLNSLLAYPEPWIRRYVLCQFDEFSGQIYEDFEWETHVIDPLPRDRIAGNAVWMGMDPGTRHPTAALWCVVDRQNGGLVGIAEYGETRLDASAHATTWRQIEAQHRMRVTKRIADPSIEVPDRGTNMTLRNQYQRLGFSFELGPRQHKDRIPMLGQLIAQGRFKLTKECQRAYEQIRDYRWTDLTPQIKAKGDRPEPDKPVKVNDDFVDAAQYLASRYVRPASIKPDGPPESWSAEIHQSIRRQQMQKRKRRSHWSVV